MEKDFLPDDDVDIHNTLKRTITDLINNNDVGAAKGLIIKYRNIIGEDEEFYSIKAVVSYIDGRLEDAESILKDGLKKYEYSVDLNFNLAKIFEDTGRLEEAYVVYLKAKELCFDDDTLLEICDCLRRIKKYIKEDSVSEIQDFYVNIIGVEPKIDVIIPTYNMKEYLKEAIDSVLEQDYRKLTIIVADDSSTDGTDKLMEKYKKFNNIRYIRHKYNMGPGENCRHVFYNYCEADYVLLLNHDDYLIRTDYISKAVDLLLVNDNISFVWANCMIRNIDTGKVENTQNKLPMITKGINYFINYELEGYPHVTGLLTTVFKRERALKMNCYNEKTRAKDLFLHLKLMLSGDVGFIEDCVAVYRVHNKSISFNMPAEYDYPTIEELETLKDTAVSMGFPYDVMEKWINFRIFRYIGWRFRTSWSMNQKRAALELLWLIKDRYPKVYDRIVAII